MLLTKRKDAPLHLQRLWSYCEVQKSEYIEKNALDLAVICFWDGDPEEWMAVLQECKLIRVERENDGGVICFRVHQWEVPQPGTSELRSEGGKKGVEERERQRKMKVSGLKGNLDCYLEGNLEDNHEAKSSLHEANHEAKPSLLEANHESKLQAEEESRGEKRREDKYTPKTPSRGTLLCGF